MIWFVFAQNELKDKGCKLILNNGVKAFKEDAIELSSGVKNPYDIAILGIGVKPETQIAKEAGIELGLRGSVKVNEYMPDFCSKYLGRGRQC